MRRLLAGWVLVVAACGPNVGMQTDAGQSESPDAAPGVGADAEPPPPPPPDAGSPPPPGPDAGCDQPATCSVEFRYPKGSEGSCSLRGDFAADGWSAGVAMTAAGSEWTATLELPNGAAVQYKFVLDGSTWIPDPGTSEVVADGFGGVNSVAHVQCGSCAPAAFDWRDGVMYFVLVDRFRNGDPLNDDPVDGVEGPANYAGGDLQGVKDAIDEGYFDGLGVNVLWLSAPIDNADGAGLGDDGHLYSGYHGYWPSQLDQTESRVGSLAILREVVDAAHARGLRVVLDYVMNHVHQESPVYAAHPDWFWPLDGCVCGQGCSWDADPDRVRCWFRDYLPDFDFSNPAARAFSVDNALWWIAQTGIDGYRLDAVKHIDAAWLYDLRDRLILEVEKGEQVFYLVGETYTNDANLIRSYVNPAELLDGQFDFPMRAQVARTLLMRQGTMWDLDGFLAWNEAFYGAGAVMGTFIGNHDLPRAIHLAEDTPQFGEWDSGKNRAWWNQPGAPANAAPYQRLALAFALLMTLPGVPLVYYGDELGLAGAGDPDNRRAMPWTGLGADPLWLRDRLSRLTAIRAAHPALRRGVRQTVGVSNDVYVYKMTSAGDEVFVALNRGDAAAPIPSLPAGSYHELVEDATVTAPATLPARSAWILVAE